MFPDFIRTVYKGSNFVITGASAGFFHNLCSHSLYYIEIESDYFKETVTDVSPYISYINSGFLGEKIYDELGGIYYVDKFKSVYDMILNIRDDTFVQEALETLKEYGELEIFIQYCKEHGMTERELQNGLRLLENGFVDIHLK